MKLIKTILPFTFLFIIAACSEGDKGPSDHDKAMLNKIETLARLAGFETINDLMEQNPTDIYSFISRPYKKKVSNKEEYMTPIEVDEDINNGALSLSDLLVGPTKQQRVSGKFAVRYETRLDDGGTEKKWRRPFRGSNELVATIFETLREWMSKPYSISLACDSLAMKYVETAINYRKNRRLYRLEEAFEDFTWFDGAKVPNHELTALLQGKVAEKNYDYEDWIFSQTVYIQDPTKSQTTPVTLLGKTYHLSPRDLDMIKPELNRLVAVSSDIEDEKLTLYFKDDLQPDTDAPSNAWIQGYAKIEEHMSSHYSSGPIGFMARRFQEGGIGAVNAYGRCAQKLTAMIKKAEEK